MPPVMVRVTVSAKAARLPFQGCSPDYITDVCKGRCCWVVKDGKPTTSIYVEPDQRRSLIVLGAVLDGRGILETTAAGKCGFQGPDGLCGVHGVQDRGADVKPRSCVISPWVLTKHNKLIIRNRYKLLGCYRAAPALPAYRAFAAGLRLLFGPETAAALTAHLDAGGGDYPAACTLERAALVRLVAGTWHADYYGGTHAADHPPDAG